MRHQLHLIKVGWIIATVRTYRKNYCMKSFKDLGIKATQGNFIGSKIDMFSILNREITVHAYKIDKSKYDKWSGKCLQLQITLDGTKHVVFTGSVSLMGVLEQTKPEDFPFTTTIKKDDKRFEFT